MRFWYRVITSILWFLVMNFWFWVTTFSVFVNDYLSVMKSNGVLILSNHFLFFVNDFLSVINSDEVLIPTNHLYSLSLGDEVLIWAVTECRWRISCQWKFDCLTGPDTSNHLLWSVMDFLSAMISLVSPALRPCRYLDKLLTSALLCFVSGFG